MAAAASVDCHLLDWVRRSVEVHWRVLREYEERAARMQHRAVDWIGRDMVDGDQWLGVDRERWRKREPSNLRLSLA